MCQIQHNQTLKNISPKINPKLNRYLVATKKKISPQKKHKRPTGLRWKMYKSINGWKTKSRAVRNWAVGLYEWRFAACVLCCALGWLRLARWFAVLGRASGILVSLLPPAVRHIQPWIRVWNCLFVCLYVCLLLHPALLFVCSGETHPGAKVWTWGACIVKGASSSLTHSSVPDRKSVV